MSDYIDLMEDALSALEALLDRTHHGKGLAVRAAYLRLDEDIKIMRRQEAQEAPKAPSEPEREVWGRRPLQDRERDVLAILSENRFSIRELTDHIAEQHPATRIWTSHATNIVNRLYRARELDRMVGPKARNGQRTWRYFRRTALEGPIADLQRVLDEEAS